MKNKYTLIAFLVFSFSKAQVTTQPEFTGINTLNPLGILHVDGAGDNTGVTPTASQQKNDFIITPEGNVGIGIVNPQYKLDIDTGGTSLAPVKGFRLVDGYEQDGFVLTSNASGIANWQPIDITVYKSDLSGSFTLNSSLDKIFYTGQSFNLPPGYWLVNFAVGIELNPSATYQVGSNFVRLRFMDSANPSNTSSYSTNISTDAVMPKYASSSFPAQASRGMLNGALAIKNDSGANKTYYLFGDQFAGTLSTPVTLSFSWNETFVYYFRIADPN